MIRFLRCSRLDKHPAFVSNGDSKAFPFSIRCICSTAIKPDGDSFPLTNHASRQNSSFTVSYLMSSCGLSEKQAILASKKVQIKNTAEADSVLSLFKNYKFSMTHISKIVEKRPLLLLGNPDENLKPHLDYFNSIGLCGAELANLILKDPFILKHNLEKTIIPVISFLKSFVHTNDKVITVIKRSTRVLQEDPEKRMRPNIDLLRSHGVSEHNIAILLVRDARTLFRADRFNEIVEEIKNMKFDPAQNMFIRAIHILSSLSKSSWETKVAVYKRWGWSEEDVHNAFRKHPICMMVSEKKIMDCMEFIVNKMGYDPLRITKHPQILMYSLEKRIIPRLSIIQVLSSNGLVEKDWNIQSVLQETEAIFLRRYITKYVEKVPELLNAYQGKMNAL